MTKHSQQPTEPSDPGLQLGSIELLDTQPTPSERLGSVTLRGEAADAMRASLGKAVTETVKAGLQTQGTYRLVPSKEAARGLADGSLKWAQASKGDASVLIKNAKTGDIAGHGILKKAGPSAKAVGPLIIWEAMAMATQQHYLVEMNDKLADIDTGVSEALHRMDDDKRGTLKQVSKVVAAARNKLAEGRDPSSARREEVRLGVRKADAIWHQLKERVVRQLDGYRQGTSSAEDVEESWAMLLFATQVLGEAGSLLTSLPFETAQDLDATTDEERERVLTALEEVRALAAELHAAHIDWSTQTAEYHLRRTRNPAKTAVRGLRKDLVFKPPVGPLDGITAWKANQLAIAPPPPSALLVFENEDGSVDVVAERDGVPPPI